jgi:hypothetical protein
LQRRTLFHSDFAQAFFGVSAAEESNYLTTFATRRGLFSFQRTPYGLHVALAIFSQLVNLLFGHMLSHLIIPSKSIDNATDILARVFEWIA